MSRRKRRIGDEDERRSRSYSPKHKRSRTNKENHEQLQSKGVAKKSWEQYSEDESSGDQNYSESRSRQHRGRHSRSESNRYQESHSESRSKKNRERHSEWESRRNLEPHSESSETGQQTCSEGERNRNWGSHLQEKMKRVQDIHSKSEKNDGHTGDIPLSEKKMDSVNLRSGGAYIPPAKLKMLQEKITDKGSIEYQRIAWEALKKSLTGLTNKVSVSNIHEVVREIFRENVIRGRGVLARAIIQAQAMSPTFTPIYAALVAIINSKFPQIGELILKRLIIQFKRSFRRNDRQVCVPAVQFIGHLLNQEVAHEVLVLEILTLLLESATDDAIELAIALLKNCGMKLTELSSRGITAIFESIRHLNYGPALSKRVRYMIDVIYAIRKDNFKDYVSVPEGLDLVDEDDKFTHLLTLEDAKDPEDILNVFKFDPDYVANEEKYKEIQRELLGESESEASDSASDSESDGEEEEEKAEENQKIHDLTETNLVALRRNIYLTIQSSLDFEECAHKLLKLELNPGQIVEMCYMILDCCAQQRTYEKFYGLLAQRFCQLNKVYVEPFTDIFKVSYETIHRFETNKLRNVAKFFAHLLYTDAISWMVLSCIKLNEDDTTSSNRIFIKILFQELCEYMGLKKLNDRVKDVTLQEAFDGLFPRDNPRNTRFAINFFTSIGLGGLTDELREHLKSAPKSVPPASASLTVAEESESSSSTSSSSFDSEDSEQSDEPKQKEKTRKKTTPPKKSSKKKKEKKHKKSSKSKKKKKR